MDLQLIKPFMTKPSNLKENVEMSSRLSIFNLKEFKGEITKLRVTFLKELYEQSFPEYRINKTSAIYFFKAGNTVIELDITVNKEIHIKPFFHYDPEHIQKDLYKIADLDYLLYCVLKVNGLQ